MPALSERNRLGDVLKYESVNLYSRDEVTIANGSNLLLGTVVGKLSSNDHITALNPSATDGSEVAIGVLANDVDARNGAAPSWIIKRHAIVSDIGLIWPDGMTEEALKTAITQLETQGILIRKGV